MIVLEITRFIIEKVSTKTNNHATEKMFKGTRCPVVYNNLNEESICITLL